MKLSITSHLFAVLVETFKTLARFTCKTLSESKMNLISFHVQVLVILDIPIPVCENISIFVISL